MREARLAKLAPRVRELFASQAWVAPPEGLCASVLEDGLRSLVEQGLPVADREKRDVAPQGQPLEHIAATAQPLRSSRVLPVRPEAIVPPFDVEKADLVV